MNSAYLIILHLIYTLSSELQNTNYASLITAPAYGNQIHYNHHNSVNTYNDINRDFLMKNTFDISDNIGYGTTFNDKIRGNRPIRNLHKKRAYKVRRSTEETKQEIIDRKISEENMPEINNMRALFNKPVEFVNIYRQLFLNFAKGIHMWASFPNSDDIDVKDIRFMIRHLYNFAQLNNNDWYDDSQVSNVNDLIKLSSADNYILDPIIKNKPIYAHFDAYTNTELSVFKKDIVHLMYMKAKFKELHDKHKTKYGVPYIYAKYLKIDEIMYPLHKDLLLTNCLNIDYFILAIAEILNTQMYGRSPGYNYVVGGYVNVYTAAIKLTIKAINNLYAFSFIRLNSDFLEIEKSISSNTDN